MSRDQVKCKIYSVTGVYPVDLRDEFLSSHDARGYENMKDRDGSRGCDPVLRAYINDCSGRVLVDSGAQVSLINEKFLNKHKNKFKKASILPLNEVIIITATGMCQEVKQQLCAYIWVQNVELKIMAMVVKNLTYNHILGVDV